MADIYSDYQQRKNEFWTTFGQIILAILVIYVVTILLLTKTVTAEAGLPILSGVTGFAIAKSVAVSKQVGQVLPGKDD